MHSLRIHLPIVCYVGHLELGYLKLVLLRHFWWLGWKDRAVSSLETWLWMDTGWGFPFTCQVSKKAEVKVL